MIESLTQYGVPGIMVFLILREVFGFIRGRNGNNPVAKMAKAIERLTGAIETDRLLSTERHQAVMRELKD